MNLWSINRSLTFCRKFTTSGGSNSNRIVKFFKGSSQEERISDYEKQLQEEEDLRRNIEAEKQSGVFKRLQNKSKLSASHHRELSGKHPLVGTVYPMESHHKSKEFRMNMFGKYGESSGVDPSVCWPTPEELADKREYEAVFYDHKDLLTLIREADEKESIAAQKAKEREEAILKNIKDMDKALLDWKNKIKMRNRAAEDQRRRRLTILKELRKEYGYDVDPNNPTYAEKIAQKEAELMQKDKEAKKAKKKAIAKS